MAKNNPLSNSIIHYAKILGAVSLFFGALGAIGITTSDYRPVWAHDIAPLMEDLILRLKKELIEYKAKKTDYERKQEPVPSWVTDKILMLEAQIKKLEKKQ